MFACDMPCATRLEPSPEHPAAVAEHPAWRGLSARTAPLDDLPLDPRGWSRSQVATWASRGGGLPARFPMNGKALCLMSRDMFRAREPVCGDRLHQDFRRRLYRALALQDLIEKLQKAAN